MTSLAMDFLHSMKPPEKPRFTFTRAQRLRGRLRFDEVYKTGKKRSAHPLLLISLRRTDNDPARLGISIGTRCGNAVKRNLIKRRIREPSRLLQHEAPPGADLLVVIKPHPPLPMRDYQ